MKQYLQMLERVRQSETFRPDRTGTGTQATFGHQYRFNLAEGFPITTTKKTFLRGIIEELLWILAGDTNNNTLSKKDVHIWDDWAAEDGQLGPVYGAQWRRWPVTKVQRVTRRRTIGELIQVAIEASNQPLIDRLVSMAHLVAVDAETHALMEQTHLGDELAAAGIALEVTENEVVTEYIDQISELLHNLRARPFSRRHVVSAWNVAQLANERISPEANVASGLMALSPCHCLFQFYVDHRSDEELRQAAGEELWQQLLDYVRELEGVDEAMVQIPADTRDLGASEFRQFIGMAKQVYDWLEAHGVKTKRLSCQLYQR